MEKQEHIPQIPGSESTKRTLSSRELMQRKVERFLAHAFLGISLLGGALPKVEAQEVHRPDVHAQSKTDAKKEDVFLKRYQNFDAMRQEIKDHATEEKIEILKTQYGGLLDQFVEFHRIEGDLSLVHQVEKNESDRDTFVHPEGLMFATIGSLVSNAFEERWAKQVPEPDQFSFVNLDAIPGFDKNRFFEVLQRYPEGYLEKSVTSIEFKNITKVGDGLIRQGETEAYGFDRMMTPGDQRSPIVIYDTPEGIVFDDFLDTFEHEAHHPSDWHNSKTLSSAERIDMLMDMTDRVMAEDRYCSPYVERIDEREARLRRQNMPEDTSVSQLLLMVKSLEYWPEIAKQYVKNPGRFKQKHPKDAEVVEKWMR